MEELACGYIGLSIDEFYKLTPRQFYNIQKGFERKKDDELKVQMILNRSLKFWIIYPHLKNQNITEEKLFPLHFEKQIKLDLEKEIEEVEKLKLDFWSKFDASKGKA